MHILNFSYSTQLIVFIFQLHMKLLNSFIPRKTSQVLKMKVLVESLDSSHVFFYAILIGRRNRVELY